MRFLSDQIDRAKWRNTLTYRVHSRVQVGIEYNPLADDVHPLANLNLVTETRSRPALVIGTSSDRIGTPEGQAYFATFSKDLERWIALPVAPYAGVAYGTYEDRARAIGGVSLRLPKQLSSLVIFDGVHVHPTISYSFREHVFSLILVRGRQMGVSYSVQF